MEDNLGRDTFHEWNQFLPLSSTLQKTQIALLDPYHSPAARGQRIIEWIDYLEKNAGWLIGSTDFSKLRAAASRGLTPQEAVDFSFKIGPYSNFGFLPASLSKLDRKELYKLDRRRRNEWWILSGKFSRGTQQGTLTLQIWRHTDRPQGVWSDKLGKAESSLWIKHTLTIGDAEPISGVTPILPESTLLVTLGVAPFSVAWGSQFFHALQQDTLFPLSTRFIAANNAQITLDLDSEKPMFMPAGNGCVQCSDGLGLKTYFFPKVTGQGSFNDEPITFEGSLEHSWESGMLPQGTASSTMVQSFDTIEQVLQSGEIFNHTGIWLHLTLHLENNYQISTYLLPFHLAPFEWLPMTSTVMSCPDGTVVTYGSNEAAFRVEHWGDDDQRIVASFRLLPKSTTKPQLFAMITGSIVNIQVSCTWQFQEFETMVGAYGFLDMTSRGRNSNTAQLTPHTDVTLSFLLWLIPLIVVVLLICLVIYLIVVRKPKYRWLQQKRRNRLG